MTMTVNKKILAVLLMLVNPLLVVGVRSHAAATERFPGLMETLQAEIGNRRMGVYIIPLDNPADVFSINADAQVPAASAWKGGGLVYFFENADPVMVNSMPVADWVHKDPSRVPPEYRKALLQYSNVLYNVFIMAVFSGNHEAGNVLAYTYTRLPLPKARNPIVAYNDWSLSIGMTPQSGMREWMAGGTWSSTYIDARYDNRQFFPGQSTPAYNVTYSARDFANFFYHLATVGKQKGYYDVAVKLLSIRNEVISLIEACPLTAYSTGMITATKDGYFRPDSPDSYGHDVDNDAGLLIFPDGATYVVAFTAFDTHDIAKDVTCKAITAIVNDHNLHSTF